MQTHDPSTAARMQVPSGRLPGLVVLTRDGSASAESRFEKPMILPAQDEPSPALHAWADARFAVDILAEHALFFMLLMPEELAAPERAEAARFHRQYLDLFERIETEGPPAPGDVRAFARQVLESFKPFVDYKARLQEAQTSGRLRSLAWPLFFEHTRHEAERWIRRLELVAGGESEFDKHEVSRFWTNIMDEHARFVAHLLDPDEFELIDKCMKTSKVFCHLHDGGAGGVVGALVDEPGVVSKSLMDNPETSAVLSAAQTILDFKTQAARDIEGGRIKSIIDPRLADHVRREALKFVDELRRVT
jgi:hypothetical protein